MNTSFKSNVKKTFLASLLLLIAFFVKARSIEAQTVCYPNHGCTGSNVVPNNGDILYGLNGAYTQLPIGTNGTCLGVSSGLPSYITCGSGGGGSGGGTFSTTTSSVPGRLNNYSNNSTDIVEVGGNSTSTATVIFDPNTLISYFKGSVGINMKSPAYTLDVAGIGNIQDHVNTSYVTATSTATSSFGGAITASGPTPGSVTVGNGMSSTTIQGDPTASSTFDNGINITKGCFAIGGVCFAGSGGGSVTSIAQQYGTGQTGAVTFSTSSDSFNGLSVNENITNSGNNFTFANNITGVLNASGGGTSISNPSAAGILIGSYAGGGWQQLATSSLGIQVNNSNWNGTDLSVSNGGTGQSTLGASQILYGAGINGIQSEATGTISCSGGISCTGAGSYVLGANLTLTAPTGAGGFLLYQSPQNAYYVSTTSAQWLLGIPGTGSTTNQLLEVHGGGYFSGNVGIATTSPYSALSVVGQVVGNNFIGTASASSSFAGPIIGSASIPFTISGGNGLGTATTTLSASTSTFAGVLGIASTSPTYALSVEGTSSLGLGAIAGYYNATSSIATSTFADGIKLTGGCFNINGTCLTSGGGGTGASTTLLTDTNTWSGSDTYGTSNIHITGGSNTNVLSTDGNGNLSWTSGGAGTVTTLTAGTGITFSSGATCTTTCTITNSGAGSNYFTNSGPNTYLSTGSLLGVGSSSPWATVAISSSTPAGVAFTAPLFSVSTSTGALGTTTDLMVDANGDTYVGSTSPSVVVGVNTCQLCIVNTNKNFNIFAAYNNSGAQALAVTNGNALSGTSASFSSSVTGSRIVASAQNNTGSPSFQFSSNSCGTACGLNSTQPTTMGLDIANYQGLTLTASTSVGIGSTSPFAVFSISTSTPTTSPATLSTALFAIATSSNSSGFGTTSTVIFEIDNQGNPIYGGPFPSILGGYTLDAHATDMTGTAYMSGAGTTATMNFGSAKPFAPHCTVTAGGTNETTAAVGLSASSTATQVIFTTAGVGGWGNSSITYLCLL